jgi:hypothetical protein
LAAGACGASAASSGTTTTTVDPDKAMLAFARCMRQHGVAMPDPQTDGGGRAAISISGGPGDKDKIEAAQTACGKYMSDAGPGQLDPAKRQRLEDAMLAFARCMRGKGFDVPDPEFSGSGGRAVVKFGAKDGQRAPDEKPGFEAADRACRKTTLEPVEKDLGLKSGGPSMKRSGPAGATSGNSTSGGKG